MLVENGGWMIVVLRVYLFNLNNPMGVHLELSPLETAISLWCRLFVYVHLLPASFVEKSYEPSAKAAVNLPKNDRLLTCDEPEQNRSPLECFGKDEFSFRGKQSQGMSMHPTHSMFCVEVCTFQRDIRLFSCTQLGLRHLDVNIGLCPMHGHLPECSARFYIKPNSSTWPHDSRWLTVWAPYDCRPGICPPNTL